MAIATAVEQLFELRRIVTEFYPDLYNSDGIERVATLDELIEEGTATWYREWYEEKYRIADGNVGTIGELEKLSIEGYHNFKRNRVIDIQEANKRIEELKAKQDIK